MAGALRVAFPDAVTRPAAPSMSRTITGPPLWPREVVANIFPWLATGTATVPYRSKVWSYMPTVMRASRMSGSACSSLVRGSVSVTKYSCRMARAMNSRCWSNVISIALPSAVTAIFRALASAGRLAKMTLALASASVCRAMSASSASSSVSKSL